MDSRFPLIDFFVKGLNVCVIRSSPSNLIFLYSPDVAIAKKLDLSLETKKIGF